MLKGKRKYTFALIVVILVTAVLVAKRLPSEHYVTIMVAVIYGYLGANAAQAVGVKWAEKSKPGTGASEVAVTERTEVTDERTADRARGDGVGGGDAARSEITMVL